MLLAAGHGSRLRPLTDTCPKCMAPIAGKPLIEHTIEWLRGHGVTRIMMNVSYLADAIVGYFGDGRPWEVEISYSREAEPLGTAGGVKRAESFFDGPFFVWYGDNIGTCRLDRLWDFHRSRGGLAGIALLHRDDPTQSGIVGLDETGRIERFLEKPRPDQVFSHWVSAGIYVLERRVLDEIPADGTPDFGRDVFPALLAGGERLYGYRMGPDERLGWIDTMADYERLVARYAAETR
jgi:NDP-sugar pyrophosphorylase family protein